MLRSFLIATLLLVCSPCLTAVSHSSVIDYKILIDGVDAEAHALEPGYYLLEVQGRVTENFIVPGTPGGFIQSSFDLSRDTESIDFEHYICGFTGSPCIEKWDSENSEYFESHQRGTFVSNGNIIQETGWMLYANWGFDFNAVGTEEYSFIASGRFMFDGEVATRITLESTPEVNLVAVLNGGNIGAGFPTGGVNGDSVLITAIPEPASLVLAGFGLIGFIVKRRCS